MATTIIILSNNDWVYVPDGVDPDHYRAELEAQLTHFKEGVFFNKAINEWEVWAGGEAVAWGDTIDQARRSYHEFASDTDVILWGQYCD